MAKLILYLLESSVALTFFYLIYILFLRRETFFSLNRFFLIGSLVFSFLFPFVRFDFNPTQVEVVERPLEEISKMRTSYYEAMAQWEFNAFHDGGTVNNGTSENNARASKIGWIKLSFAALLLLYVTGIIVCISRTVWTLRWIWKMIHTYPIREFDGVKVIKHPNPIAPFSFFKYVFVYHAMVDTPEFEQILAHERTHIQQRHSIDLVFVQLLAAILWFNPVIWRLIKSLKTTHEYIADKKIISSGYSLVEYQTLLLQQLISNNAHGLVHNFNLSFIKKRITMMKNKQSGWPGKAKVATAIAASAFIGAILVQCNSRLDESLPSNAKTTIDDFSNGVNLPVLPSTGYAFKGDATDVLNFTVAENKLTVDGNPLEVADIVSLIEKGGVPSLQGFVVMRIDKDQTMGLVRSIDWELRKADRLKILYVGQTSDGTKVETSLLLPPTPENAAMNGMPLQPDISDVEAEGKTDILKIDIGDHTADVSQQKVYDFVQRHIAKKSSDYVVSFRYTDTDTYGDYLVNLVHIKEGFNQIYQERSQKTFGKDYYSLDKGEFKQVREGIPMAISIAEKREL